MEQNEHLTPIFCYGSNHPAQIAERLKLDLDYVLKNWFPCTLKGYRRAFEGVAPFWEDKSAATIVKSGEDDINAFAFCMTDDQVAQMDVYEDIPTFYTREDVELVKRDGEVVKGQVYIMNPTGIYNYPSDEYLKRCGFSFMCFHYLHHDLDENFNLFNLTFPVYSAVDGKKDEDHVWKGEKDKDVIESYWNSRK